MSYEITSEGQAECDTPKRASIHKLVKDLGRTVDAAAFIEKTSPSVIEDILKGPRKRPSHPKNSSIDISKDPDVPQSAIEIPFPPKPPIHCLYSAHYVGDLTSTKASLIFTHGAGGTLQTDAIVNFTHGFVSLSTRPTLLCFKGNMNLASRVKMFSTVLEFPGKKSACLGGRSMGARAAVMAVTDQITHLVLVSYPLNSKQQVRDQILLELPATIKVLFISGERDEMCDFERMETVRKQMKCKTWMIVVQGADHGMNAKSKPATRELGRMTGALAANWLDECDERLTEGNLSWDTDKSAVQWSDWRESQKMTTAHRIADEEPSADRAIKSSSKASAAKDENQDRKKRNAEASEASKSKKRRIINK